MPGSHDGVICFSVLKAPDESQIFPHTGTQALLKMRSRGYVDLPFVRLRFSPLHRLDAEHANMSQMYGDDVFAAFTELHCMLS